MPRRGNAWDRRTTELMCAFGASVGAAGRSQTSWRLMLWHMRWLYIDNCTCGIPAIFSLRQRCACRHISRRVVPAGPQWAVSD
eukprot:4928434-Pyramimonas_sp.AAC.1